MRIIDDRKSDDIGIKKRFARESGCDIIRGLILKEGGKGDGKGEI